MYIGPCPDNITMVKAKSRFTSGVTIWDSSAILVKFNIQNSARPQPFEVPIVSNSAFDTVLLSFNGSKDIYFDYEIRLISGKFVALIKKVALRKK